MDKSINKLKSKPDEWLIKKFRATGDLDFLGSLYEKYMHLVYGVCLKYLQDRATSQDAVMQIFEKLIIEIPNREIDNFKPWLYVITKNYCLMYLRSMKTRIAREESAIESSNYFMESSYELHHNDDPVLDKDMDALKKCIDELKTEQKECIKLFYLEEYCYQEIADKTKLELKKVKSHIQNGKRNLRICMEQNG